MDCTFEQPPLHQWWWQHAGHCGMQNIAPTAVMRAVGSGKEACRVASNCWEVGKWDGAVGWNRGGKDWCDPAYLCCGPNG